MKGLPNGDGAVGELEFVVVVVSQREPANEA
jgi:hypothetical protein